MNYKYYRCQTCGLLITDAMIARKICLGHRVKIAIRGNMWEWFLIKLGLYEWFMLKFKVGASE